jgi:hypothetical protein
MADDAQNLAPLFLFQNYVVEIVKYFRSIRSHILDNQEVFTQANGDAPIPNPNFGLPMPLYVTFGNPKAAFRRMIERFNGLTRLPYMNITIGDHMRKPEFEPVGVRYFIREEGETPADLKTTIHTPPMQFQVDYKCSLSTTSNQERDHILYQIYLLFPRLEISLIVKDPGGKGFVFVPMALDPNFTDATSLESSDNKDPREFVRTDFVIHAKHTVPLPYREVPVITNIQFQMKTSGYPSAGILDFTDDTRYDMIKNTDGTIGITIS